ncbi:phBC6A51 family helix-turn-helix protein [Oceanobacillus caeni]|uniref:phBC6A51 family helix-turn-helix protein n=1 Tax=Virgibacillus sp. SK37 TaxID=403957 RepID=UPI00119D0B57|nr:phBC6A51 family helix-turn-helix protein [Virgibacillus sp. SK37]
MLTDKKKEAIKLLASGEMTVQDIAKHLEVSRGTIYYWLKDNEFKTKLEEMNKLRNAYLKQELKDKAGNYIKSLESLSVKSKNDMVKLRALEDLLMHGGWTNEQDININTNNDNANKLLEMWKRKKQESNEDE